MNNLKDCFQSQTMLLTSFKNSKGLFFGIEEAPLLLRY